MNKKFINTINFLIVILGGVTFGYIFSLSRNESSITKKNLEKSLVSNNNSNPQIKKFSKLIDRARKENKNSQYENSIKTFYQAIDVLSTYALKDNFDSNSSSIFQEIAENYILLGKYNSAEKLIKDSLKLRERLFGLKNIEVAKTLDNLGTTNKYQGEYKNAENNFIKSLKIKEEILEDDNLEIYNTVSNLYALYIQQGFFDKAEVKALRALNFANKNFNKNDPKVAISKNNLGRLYLRNDKFNLSKNLFISAIDILKNTIGENHPTTLKVKSNLAKFYRFKGSYKEAENILKNNLELIKKQLGDNDLTTAEFQSLLADLYLEMNLYRKAEDLYLISLETKQKLLKPQSIDLIKIKNRIGLLYSEQGRYKEAEEILKNAFLSYQGDSKNNPIVFASVLNNLYVVLLKQGKLEEAKSQLLRSKNIIENSVGKKSREYIVILSNLGITNQRQGLYEISQLYFQEALELSKKYLGENNLITSSIQNNIAVNYSYQNRFLEAEPYLLDALKINKKILGNKHAKTSQISISLAYLYLLKGQENKIEKYAYEGLKQIFNLIQKESQYLALNNRESFLQSLRSSYMTPFQWALDSKSGARMALFSRLNHQGLLQEIERQQAQISRQSPSQNSNIKEISKIVSQLSSNELSSELRISLIKKKALLERELPVIENSVVEIEQVSEVMPENSVLIEFQKYNQIIFSDNNEAIKTKLKYLALILKPNKEIISIDLGPADILENKIKESLFQIKQGSSLQLKAIKEINNLVINPLFESIGDENIWFISPDGELNNLPFTILRSPKNNKLLVEEIKIRNITTGRDLLKLNKKSKKLSNSSIVLANPDFDNHEGELTIESGNFAIEQKLSINLNNRLWDSLPGTQEEGEIISEIINAELLTLSKATTLNIQKQNSPQILHIASHAYYLPDPKNNFSESPDFFLVQKDSKFLPRRFQSDNPLLRSGVVLAGANKKNPISNDDGYLTAMEASLLDLENTELVIISGCESGKGDLKTGEGVYGLKRSIAVAGGKSSILTLWKVDDMATAAFMESFYKRLKSGDSREDALLLTQKDFRLGVIKNPSEVDNNWDKPFYWASFNLTGDWKQIDL